MQFVDTPAVSRDRRFCDSFRNAAGSTCRNIAEGFGRFESREILLFFRYALASLSEVKDHLEECRSRRFIDADQFQRLWDIAEHTKATSLNFIKPHIHRAHRSKKRRHPS